MTESEKEVINTFDAKETIEDSAPKQEAKETCVLPKIKWPKQEPKPSIQKEITQSEK